jgi:zeta-carotene desaturase
LTGHSLEAPARGKDVIVIGGGLSGLAAAAALGASGFRVRLFESKPFLGGRATSYEAGSEVIDNCQHILLRCCTNLLDFYKRLNVTGAIQFYRDFTFIEPGGRRSVMRAGMLPAPAHFAGSFLRLRFLNLSEKIAIARAFEAIRREGPTRTDLDRISMQQWLEEKRQPTRAIERFWRQVLVSAINEELDRIAAAHGFQVFELGFLANSTNYEMGVPRVPLADLYGEESWSRIGNVEIHLRSAVQEIEMAATGEVRSVRVNGETLTADCYVCALPFERAGAMLPSLDLDLSEFEHSPITGIHLWFDRPVTDLPHATLLDRTIQWMFNKSEGHYIQLVVSASRSLVAMPRGEVIDLALRELKEFLPLTVQARLEKSHVVKEIRATFSAKPGLERFRPVAKTQVPNLFLAGDWTNSGWPATMEGAVRSGYLAAEAVTLAAREPRNFLVTQPVSKTKQ